jgi:hypothetical protein
MVLQILVRPSGFRHYVDWKVVKEYAVCPSVVLVPTCQIKHAVCPYWYQPARLNMQCVRIGTNLPD